MINLTPARALAWQRHIIAVRQQLGLPDEGTASVNVAALAAIDSGHDEDLAELAMDQRFDLIVAVWPHAKDTPQRHVIALRTVTGCTLTDCEFIEVAREQPLALYLPQQDQHLVVDVRANLSIVEGCPVEDLQRARRRAATRLRKSAAKHRSIPSWAGFDVYPAPPSARSTAAMSIACPGRAGPAQPPTASTSAAGGILSG